MRILYLVADSLRADVLSAYGGGVRTPNLEQLAAEGVRAQSCFASGGWTVPSVASLITGRYPHRVGTVLWRHGLPADVPNLFARYAEAGGPVSSFPFSTRWMFRDVPEAGVVASSQNVPLLASHLEASGEDELTYVHYWWMHVPYVPDALGHESWKAAVEGTLAELNANPSSRDVVKRYEASVLHFDREVLPRLVDAVTRGGRRVLVVVTADHGEDFGASQPGRPRFDSLYDLHGRHLTEATCRVPLVFWGTGIEPRKEPLGGLARGVDVPETIAAKAGLDPVEAVDGVDLSRAIRTGDPAPADFALTVSPHNTFEETVVPDDPGALWRLWSVRDAKGRWTWDRTTGERRAFAVLAGGSEMEIDPADADESGWERIERAAAEAVPAPRTEGEQIAEALRGLGYFA